MTWYLSGPTNVVPISNADLHNVIAALRFAASAAQQPTEYARLADRLETANRDDLK